MYLLDINIWLALTFGSHVHHQLAFEWFEKTQTASCAFCRFTQQGYLRLASNPSIFGKESVSLGKAWQLYEMLLSDNRVFFLTVEPDGLESKWKEYTLAKKHTHKIWSDAYLAAFAQTKNFTLATLDKDFLKFSPELKVELLKA